MQKDSTAHVDVVCSWAARGVSVLVVLRMYLRGRAVSCRLQPPFSPQELPERDQPGGQCRVACQGWDLLSSQEAELVRQATAPRPVRPARGAHGRGKCPAGPLASGRITSRSAPHAPASRHSCGRCSKGATGLQMGSWAPRGQTQVRALASLPAGGRVDLGISGAHEMLLLSSILLRPGEVWGPRAARIPPSLQSGWEMCPC